MHRTSHPDNRTARTPVLATTALLTLTSCAAFAPQLLTVPDDLEHVQTQTAGAVQASVAILLDEQAEQHFGVDLAAQDIQVLWLRIRNESEHTLWLVRNIIDPDFYPPDEAAQMVRGSLNDEDFERLCQHLRDESMRIMLPPRTEVDGCLFLPHEEGGRYVDLRLAKDAFEAEEARRAGIDEVGSGTRLWRMGFAIPLPDGDFDYERLDTRHTYPDLELPDLELDELRTALEELPGCASDADGEEEGDPLNLVIVGEAWDVLNTLSRSGWSFTHRITFESIRRLVGAAISGDAYPVAPVSDLYVFGRPQDFALQRARASISQRNHMRLWLAPFTHREQQVWIGQVSRDVGIKLTTESATLTTHVIDPEIDLAREYLLHSLLAGGFVEQLGFVRGAPRATRLEPRTNLTSDPYFTDGLRVVILLSSQPVPYNDVRNLLWERSDAPIAEGQSEAARRHVRPID